MMEGKPQNRKHNCIHCLELGARMEIDFTHSHLRRYEVTVYYATKKKRMEKKQIEVKLR